MVAESMCVSVVLLLIIVLAGGGCLDVVDEAIAAQQAGEATRQAWRGACGRGGGAGAFYLSRSVCPRLCRSSRRRVHDYVPAPVVVCTLATGGLQPAPQRGEQVGVQRPQVELQQPGRRVPPGMERSYLVHVCVAPVINVPIYSLHAERDGVRSAARDVSLSIARSSAS